MRDRGRVEQHAGKWTGTAHSERPDWIDSATPLPTAEVGALLRKLKPRGMVYRPTQEPRWECAHRCPLR